MAHALEAVALIAERRTHTATWANPTRQRLRFARCCYGHLAGQLGVELFSPSAWIGLSAATTWRACFLLSTRFDW